MSSPNDRILGTWVFEPAPQVRVSMTFSADGKIISEFHQGPNHDRKEGTFSVTSHDGDLFVVSGSMDGQTNNVHITLCDNDTSAKFEGLGPQPFQMKKQ